MKPTYEELKHTAVEMSQQDWNDLRFADVYYDAFVAGGKWFMQRYEQLEQQRNELAAQVDRLKNDRDEALAYAEQLRGAALGMLMNRSGINEWYALENSVSEQPPVALAALKAECQAEALKEIARIAHHGGLIGFSSDADAMIEIRRLTIGAWDKRAQEAGDE